MKINLPADQKELTEEENSLAKKSPLEFFLLELKTRKIILKIARTEKDDAWLWAIWEHARKTAVLHTKIKEQKTRQDYLKKARDYEICLKKRRELTIKAYEIFRNYKRNPK